MALVAALAVAGIVARVARGAPGRRCSTCWARSPRRGRSSSSARRGSTAKALAIASPAVPALRASIGRGSAHRARGRRGARRRPRSSIARASLWSNALAYREVNLAPRDQLAELELIGEQIAGEGPTLMTEYQPYGVRHFLRDADAEGASELRRRQVPLRGGEETKKGAWSPTPTSSARDGLLDLPHARAAALAGAEPAAVALRARLAGRATTRSGSGPPEARAASSPGSRSATHRARGAGELRRRRCGSRAAPARADGWPRRRRPATSSCGSPRRRSTRRAGRTRATGSRRCCRAAPGRSRPGCACRRASTTPGSAARCAARSSSGSTASRVGGVAPQAQQRRPVHRARRGDAVARGPRASSCATAAPDLHPGSGGQPLPVRARSSSRAARPRTPRSPTSTPARADGSAAGDGTGSRRLVPA